MNSPCSLRVAHASFTRSVALPKPAISIVTLRILQLHIHVIQKIANQQIERSELIARCLAIIVAMVTLPVLIVIAHDGFSTQRSTMETVLDAMPEPVNDFETLAFTIY